jgi:hypothetical protein
MCVRKRLHLNLISQQNLVSQLHWIYGTEVDSVNLRSYSLKSSGYNICLNFWYYVHGCYKITGTHWGNYWNNVREQGLTGSKRDYNWQRPPCINSTLNMKFWNKSFTAFIVTDEILQILFCFWGYSFWLRRSPVDVKPTMRRICKHRR